MESFLKKMALWLIRRLDRLENSIIKELKKMSAQLDTLDNTLNDCNGLLNQINTGVAALKNSPPSTVPEDLSTAQAKADALKTGLSALNSLVNPVVAPPVDPNAGASAPAQ